MRILTAAFLNLPNPMELLQIKTANDRNGNSRILWVAIERGAVVDGEEHYYNKPERFRHQMDVAITVSPTEFKRWKYILAAVQEQQFLENGPRPMPA